MWPGWSFSFEPRKLLKPSTEKPPIFLQLSPNFEPLHSVQLSQPLLGSYRTWTRTNTTGLVFGAYLDLKNPHL